MRFLPRQQKGLSLFELLLVIAIFGALFTGAVKITEDWQKDQINRNVAYEMLKLQSAAEAYVNLNFNTILGSFGAVGDTLEITIADLIADGFLPAGYSGVNSYRQGLRVVARYVDDGSGIGVVGDNVIEVISFSTPNGTPNRIADSRLVKAAKEGGPKLGYISNITLNAACCANDIAGAFGTWQIPLADYAAHAPALPTANADGGYMAAYGRINGQNTSLTRNYLLRVDDPSFADANMMEANLNINGNDITNANYIVSDDAQVATDVTINNVGNRPVALTVGNPDGAGFGGLTTSDITVNSGGDATKGSISVLGDLGNIGADVTVNNDLTVLSAAGNGNIVSNTLTAGGDLNIGNRANLEILDMTNHNLTSNNIYSIDTDYTNVMTVDDTLQSNTASGVNTLNSSSLVSTQLDVGNTTNIGGGDVTVDNVLIFNGNSAASNVNRTAGTNEVYIQSMPTCVSGCGL